MPKEIFIKFQLGHSFSAMDSAPLAVRRSRVSPFQLGHSFSAMDRTTQNKLTEYFDDKFQLGHSFSAMDSG